MWKKRKAGEYLSSDAMDCEICGRNAAQLFLISVESTRLKVCGGCSKSGTFISKVEERYTPKARTREEPEIELADNYAELLREARAKLGLNQEDLARQINENLNVIKKIEKGEIKPTEKTARKLEKLYNIKLFRTVEKEAVESKKAEISLTLEDIAVMK